MLYVHAVFLISVSTESYYFSSNWLAPKHNRTIHFELKWKFQKLTKKNWITRRKRNEQTNNVQVWHKQRSGLKFVALHTKFYTTLKTLFHSFSCALFCRFLHLSTHLNRICRIENFNHGFLSFRRLPTRIQYCFFSVFSLYLFVWIFMVIKLWVNLPITECKAVQFEERKIDKTKQKMKYFCFLLRTLDQTFCVYCSVSLKVYGLLWREIKSWSFHSCIIFLSFFHSFTYWRGVWQCKRLYTCIGTD